MLAFTLFLSATLNILGDDLKQPIDNNGQKVAPQGIVSFELVHSGAEADRMIPYWGATGRIRAAFNPGLDYLFIFAYANTRALGCVWVAPALRGRGFAK